ncbi:MAG: hypothetical protein JEZ07_00095 [Phycisphaerae bacterium]|nr:hypothetical protein [Phycisphaerae bacterium]
MIQFRCTQCDEAMEAPESMTGELLQCPRCKYPGKVPASTDFAIELEGQDNDSTSAPSITAFGGSSSNKVKDRKFNRPLNSDGTGATRVKTFHSVLSDTAIEYMDDHIDEWIDKHPGIEVKFTNMTIGLMGKRSEPHLIMTVWY